ncbi:MAG: serine/threonine protein kinase, partial [Nostocales cyanobacterium W4_Combined_metabat2_030]|nr:serine/threonine protein kinase [Nostocales cyanobacterium W4_Combined_metabat2_030]
IKVEQRTQELKQKNEALDLALQELKAAQKQMVAQEKLAFLGTLTAGIAHEIRNPLNFVKNFATISVDLTQELKEEIDNQTEQLQAEAVEYIDEIFTELKDSIVEIEKQGQRIESIIVSMMMHAQKESGQPEITDINTLIAEAVHLAYHSFRAKKDSVDITISSDYDSSVGEVKVVPQEISRALVNIVNNACYAVTAKRKALGDSFSPLILVKTLNLGDGVEISIRDNGLGMTQDILDKVFNPFFTTKPPGEGTGLGLSLTYEIIVGQHQGEIKAESVSQSHTEFTIILPKKVVK